MNSFLSQVAKVYIDNESKNLSDFCFVFPNKRSGVFFSDYRNKHKCNKCGHTEMLVGIYPYIKDNEDDE